MKATGAVISPAFWIVMLAASALPAQTGDNVEHLNSIEERISARTFPSILQAWNPADNLPTEDRLTTLSRHDLVFHAPGFFGLKWGNAYPGLATAFAEDSIAKGREMRSALLKKNPCMILIAEIRYRDAARRYLPEGHRWWMRGRDGQPEPG